MSANYYKSFDVILIDSAGAVTPLASDSLDVWDVTTASSLGTVSTDANGVVTEGTLSGDAGDIIEFTRSGNAGVFRLKLTATQAEAYTDPYNFAVAFVLDNAMPTTTMSEVAYLYARNNAQPTLPPKYLGLVEAGATTLIPYQTAVEQNLTLFLVSQSQKRQLTTLTPELAESSILTVPATSIADLPLMTSAQLAGKVSDETGTAGKLVFSTSPVLVAPILGTPNSGLLTNCTGFPAANLSGMASWMPSFLTTPNITDVRGGTFNAAGTTPFAGRYFYVSTSGSFATGAAGVYAYLNNTNPANTATYGVKGEARQGVDRSGGAGVIYGGEFLANVAGDVETAYGLYGKLSIDATQNAYEAGCVIFGTTINGNVSNAFSGLKQELINSGTVANFYGTFTRIQNGSGGTMTAANALRISILQGGNTIPNFKGIAFESYSGSGAITNNYLLYADTSTASYGSTNKYGIYFLPDMPSYHVGKVGIGSGATAPTARLQVRDTTEPLRLEYDVNNYMKAVVGSTGMVTFDAVGSGTTGFTFSDAVTFPGAARFRGYTSSTNPPSTTELPNDKDFCIHEETDIPNFWLAFNRGGTIYKVALV